MWDTMIASLAKDLAYTEASLSQHRFIAGDQFTAADIMMAMALLAPRQFAASRPLPDIDACLERLAEQPAFRRARPFD